SGYRRAHAGTGAGAHHPVTGERRRGIPERGSRVLFPAAEVERVDHASKEQAHRDRATARRGAGAEAAAPQAVDRSISGLPAATDTSRPRSGKLISVATFIPPSHKESARDLQVSRVLSALSDDYVVRRPLCLMQCPADLFIQHRIKGWLAM